MTIKIKMNSRSIIYNINIYRIKRQSFKSNMLSNLPSLLNKYAIVKPLKIPPSSLSGYFLTIIANSFYFYNIDYKILIITSFFIVSSLNKLFSCMRK